MKLKKHAINLILGPSGSGKSSLAYDTIAQIGIHEMNSMFADEVVEPRFKVNSYHNMLATVAIPQINNNNNIRSTIGTYFGINRYFALIYSVLLRIDQDYFTLNKEENLCTQCRGIGFLRELDINLILDYSIPLEKCPIRCWTRKRDFYTQIIKKFCIEKGIDYRKTFRELNETEKRTILFGESSEKYSIRYKSAGVTSSRTTKYYGAMTGIPMIPKFTPAKQFLSDHVCTNCNGRKYSNGHNEYKVHGLSIGELMCTPFSELGKWIENALLDIQEANLEFSITHIRHFINKSVELDLGHLFFNRAIPTLSGGELQRLRLVQVFNTQLVDLLVILDEPLAGLSGKEKLSVYRNIVQLSNKHSIVLVDHHETFVSNAKVIITLGEKSGEDGGNIINTAKYLESQRKTIVFTPLPISSRISVKSKSSVYDYKGIELEIADNRLNIIIGKSGIGKSTLLREYLPQVLEHYTYINQKALGGNKYSSVASSLDISELITSDFAKIHKKEKRFFSVLSGGEGACRKCFGTGYVDYGSEYQIKARIECKDCLGTGFDKKLKKYKVKGKNIFDVWTMTINEGYVFYREVNPRIAAKLNEAIEIMLGHLRIGQMTTTLSGGENIRIKILRSMNSTATIYGIDEPFRGLGTTEIYQVVKFLNKLVEKKITIIVADHADESFRFFSKRIFLTCQNHRLIGVDYDTETSVEKNHP